MISVAHMLFQLIMPLDDSWRRSYQIKVGDTRTLELLDVIETILLITPVLKAG